MAKHEGELIADIDDGFAKIANLLLEALCCMPLSGSEHQVLFFIIRRTYGWAKSSDRDSGKTDIICSWEIAEGTGLTQVNVRKCLAKLASKKVITAAKMSADNKMSYGLNPVVIEWGAGNEKWDKAKDIMRSAQAKALYVKTSRYETECHIPIRRIVSEVYDRASHRYETERLIPIGQSVSYPEPVSPCVARPDGVPTDSITDIYTNNDSNNLMSPQKKPAATKQNKKELDEKIEVEIQTLRDTFEAADLAQAEDFIELVRSHRKNRVVAKVTIKKTLELLLAIRNEQGITSEAFAYGIEAAIKKDADNTNYVKQAARGYRPNTTSTPRRLNMSIPPSTAWPKKTEVI